MIGTKGLYNGLPGLGAEVSSSFARAFITDDHKIVLPGGVIIDGAKARDPIASIVRELSANILVGKITASGKYGTSIIGKTTQAIAAGGTTLTVGVATAVELVRRIGASGNLKLVGPPTAAGVVVVQTLAFTAVNTATGAITVTNTAGAAVNEVQTVAVDSIMTDGSIALEAVDKDGKLREVKVAYNTSWTQTVADIQTALIAVLGTAAVACAVTNTTDMTITFSGANYAGVLQTLVDVDISAATGPTKVSVTRTTAGAAATNSVAACVTDSLVMSTDGSETILGVPDLYDTVNVLDVDGVDRDVSVELAVGGFVDATLLRNWPADTSTRAWLRAQMNAYGRWLFYDVF